jgi:Zn-dependent alcohol dehydrogenase
VIAVDISAGKLETARVLGATDVIDPTKDDPTAVVKGMARGRGATMCSRPPVTRRPSR